MNRRKARERVIQVLYQSEFNQEAGFYIPIDGEETEKAKSSEGFLFAQRLFFCTKKKQEEIDLLISPLLKTGWSLERLSVIDLSILRLAIYELLYERQTPPQVVINEAVDLAKIFSCGESPSFINGVLGSFVQKPLV